jgi:CheY-like chemotaxis protein
LELHPFNVGGLVGHADLRVRVWSFYHYARSLGIGSPPARRPSLLPTNKFSRSWNKSAARTFDGLCDNKGRRSLGFALLYHGAHRLTSFEILRYRTGWEMTADSTIDAGKIDAGKRVLVVEDEPMIRLLLDDMLADLGYTMAAEAGRLDEALAKAKDGAFDVAILDVNLNGQPITPVVEVLVERGVPFVFVSGYARRGIPEMHSQAPLLQKPFQVDGLASALAAIAAKAAN